MTLDCTVYRCKKQDEMYLYVRSDLETQDLPGPLLRQVGALTQVMQLSLTAETKLVRANAATVLQKLEADGFYLQMPPSGLINPQLYSGD